MKKTSLETTVYMRGEELHKMVDSCSEIYYNKKKTK